MLLLNRGWAAIELRPTALNDLGIVPAVDAYVQEWSQRNGVAAQFQVSGIGIEQRLPELVETSVYRVVQEALTNISRHCSGTVTKVSVTLQRFEGQMLVVVEDDGPGFDAPAAMESGRLGLVGMRERAASCGGTLEVESTPGEGTSVFLRVPLLGQQ